MTRNFAAIAAWFLSLAASLPAAAVYLSGSGFGQALIYPYYTVRSTDGNAFNTYIAVGNADVRAKALRVRFREGRNGREALGFNLFLHAKTVWAAALVPGPGGVRLITRDPTCSIPAFNEPTGSAPFLELSAAAFTGAQADGAAGGEDRLREGYVEVIEMAALHGTFINSSASDCTDVRAGRLPTLDPPSGYLHGSVTLINVQSGLDFTIPAEALANLATAAYYRPPDDPYVDFNAGEVGRVASFLLNDRFYRIEMPTPVGAVEAALARRHIVNEVALDPVTQSATDWVITMPTWRFHTAGIPSPWFTSALSVDGGLRMGGAYLSRNGGSLEIGVECGFPCLPHQSSLPVVAPAAVTVLGFMRDSNVTSAPGTTQALGSVHGWVIGVPNAGSGGAAEFAFHNPGTGVPSAVVDAVSTSLANGATANQRVRLYGIPMIGFMARTLRNGTLDCGGGNCQGNYGAALPHHFRRELGTVQ
jgi:hypothetical protein